MRILYTVLFCVAFFATSAEATKTYRWVDDQGVVHYSDAPNPASKDPEADTVNIRQPNVIPSRTAVPRATSSSGDSSEAEGLAGAYESLTIASPAKDDTLWNIGGRLQVSVQVAPKLRAGHGLVFYFDGRLLEERPTAANSITINDVYRGEHSVRAAVRDASGKELIGSELVTFFVHQSTVN